MAKSSPVLLSAADPIHLLTTDPDQRHGAAGHQLQQAKAEAWHVFCLTHLPITGCKHTPQAR